MRPLLIDVKAKQDISEVRAWANQNIYRPGKSETIPGDDPRHVVRIFKGFRCVFSMTENPDNGQLLRHLSISVPGSDYPNPIAAYVIATEFGFTGWQIEMGEKPPLDWLMDVNKEDHCLVLVQSKECK